MTLLAAFYICMAHRSDAYYRRAVSATLPVPAMFATDPTNYEPVYATACVKIVPAEQAVMDKQAAAEQAKQKAAEAGTLEALNELAGTLP